MASVTPLPGVLKPGSSIKCTGTPNNHYYNFAINLQCGDSTDYSCDIAFHFNPRHPEQVTVRNTKKNGQWEVEERDQKSFPFQPGQRFDLNIIVSNDEYKVLVNGKHYIDYNHRIPYSEVTYVMLTGDCSFHTPEFTGI